MMWGAPVTMNLQPMLPACVVDVPLALSPYGLGSVLQLARATRVWLAPTLWSIIEDEAFYLNRAEFVSRITPSKNGTPVAPNRDAARRIIDQWRQARDELGLDVRERLYWPSEKMAEAVVPKGGDARLIDRMDALAAALDRRWRRRRGVSADEVDILADCARDTVALAATLVEDRPIVLTTRPANGSAPDIGSYLSQSDVECRHLEDMATLRLLRTSIAPLLVSAGLVELVAAAGLRLVAVSLLAPASHLLVSRTRSAAEEDLRWTAPDSEPEDDMSLWDGASAVWYELP